MFPVSREKYNAAIAEVASLKNLLELKVAEVEQQLQMLALANTRTDDLNLEVQQLHSLLDSDKSQTQINELTQELTDANLSILNLEENLDTRNKELSTANTRITELETAVQTIKTSAVDPSKKAVTQNDSSASDSFDVKFFEDNADDTAACLTRLKELGF